VAATDIEKLTRASLPADWSALDTRAVDTVRVLAADAVQYTLFQRVMRHDPDDGDWIGRDRFVLSCGHLFREFGFTTDDVVAAARRSFAKTS
jgi:transketolase